MNLQKLLLVICCLLFCMNSVFCQDYTDSSKTMVESSIWGIKVDWGYTGGLSLGGRINLSPLTSVEFSYGTDYKFWYFPNYNSYKLALNFHNFLIESFSISSCVAIHTRAGTYKKGIEYILSGVEYGFYTNARKGINPICKLGAYCEYSSEYRQFQIFLNFDLGVSIDF
ncbi:MAG: hypothetical protein V1720_08195 [bacterium]